jgi:hypothetical protein
MMTRKNFTSNRRREKRGILAIADQVKKQGKEHQEEHSFPMLSP